MECDPVAAQDLIVVVTSVGTEDQALDVAHALIRNRQAACVNILPNVHSIYRWKGRVCDDTEWLLMVKTVAETGFPA
jgi:periplasmic divalent cation tolerance protein